MGQEGEGRGGGHDACPPPRPLLPVDIAREAFTAGGTEPPSPGLASCTRQVLVLGSVTLLLFPLLGVPQCEGEGRGSAPAIRRPP